MRPLWKNSILPAGAIVLVTLVCYLPAMRAGLVWDDKPLLFENPIIQASDGLYRIWFTAEPVDYCPLTWSMFWLEWRWCGMQPARYHITNILLHAVSAVLVWRVLRQLNLPAAWLAGLVFAIHPVNVASVAWISERKNTLAMVFFLLTLLFYLKFDANSGRRWYGLSLGMFLLALTAKASVVTAPLLLLVCAAWRRRTVTRLDVWCLTPFFILAGVMTAVAFWFQQHNAIQEATVRTEDWLSRIATMGWMVWFYIYKAMVPFNLSMIYPRWQVDGWQWVSWLPGLGVLLCLVIFWIRRKTWGRAFLFGFGTFLITIAPVLGFCDMYWFLFSFVADHWQYISIISIIALVVCGAGKIREGRSARIRRMMNVLALLVVGTLSILTWQQTLIYKDEQTLWHDTLRKNPNAWIAWYNLGSNSLMMGREQEAYEGLSRSIDLWPGYAKAHSNLGTVLVNQGQLAPALDQFNEALRLNPKAAASHYNAAAVLVRMGKIDEAVPHYLEAVRLQPDFVKAMNDVATIYYQQGKLESAAEYFRRAVRLKPDDPELHLNLGNTLARQGKATEAIDEYRQALKLKPEYAFAHNNLGLALTSQGKMEEAVFHYREALRIDPAYEAAEKNLKLSLAGNRPMSR
jgi:Flp pilus assembly protein TadD